MIPTTFLEMKVHNEHFWGVSEVRGLKPNVVVPAQIISNERQTRKGFNMVTVRQYGTNRVGVIMRLRIGWRLVLPDCEDKSSVNVYPVHPTVQVAQLPLILHVKWSLLQASLVMSLDIMLIT